MLRVKLCVNLINVKLQGVVGIVGIDMPNCVHMPFNFETRCVK